MLPVAILAGGLASRLYPLTRHVPKSLLPIAGRPFIFHQLELLRNQGAERVVLCVCHLGEQIEAAVGNGRRFGLAVDYSVDGSQPLGTGGALKRALPLLGSEFFVLYGDSYLPCSLTAIQAAFAAAREPALMTVLRNDNRWGCSNVALRDDGSIEYDKRSSRRDLSYIDFGLSVLCGEALQPFPDCFDLADAWRDLSVARQLAAFEVDGRFYEIGSRQGIEDTEKFLSRNAGIA
jgi:NDP-sugar pyrophosphorylase family protein